MAISNNSVPPGKSSCDQDLDRNEKVVVIEGLRVIESLDSEYLIEHLTWERACAHIRNSFRQKTSRSVKNGKEYETTRWYRVHEDGSMKSTGSAEEPDYSKFYSPEPKPRYGFKVCILNPILRGKEHIVIEEKVFLENQKLFKDCLVFKLSDCQNRIHELYANPKKCLSVRVPKEPGSSGKDRRLIEMAIAKGGSVDWDKVHSNCLNDGDCDNCEVLYHCPCPESAKGDPEFPEDESEE